MHHVTLSVLINIFYLRITGLIMSAHPFIRDIAHVFDGAIADPGHEFTVKLELWPALGKQEAPDVLGVPVVGVNDRVPGDGTAMPIEIHAAILPDI
ncbi:hypothetical protein IGS61_01590 [Janthinobacterium sp. FW305-129]|nr:hypothetical protein [Janthinobacterium sp. FW305-129]